MSAPQWNTENDEVSPFDRDSPYDREPAYEPTGTDDPEAPTDDRAEQSHPVGDDSDPRPAIGFEVNEWDAVEQTRTVPHDEDDDYR